MPLRIGLGLFTAQLPEGSPRTFAREYAETLEMVRLAERVGFDSVWVSEHHGSSDGYLPSLLTLLAAFAAVTERVELGTGVVLAPLHDPIRLAEDAAVVDQLSGGRVLLGLGVGWREEEFRMFGASLAGRAARLEDTVEVLRRAWTGERFTVEGRTLTYRDVKVTPPAARPGGPPIYLGGYADAAVRRAGRLGDGYITDDTGEIARYAALADAAARDAGRGRGAVVLLQNVYLGEWSDVRDGVAQQLGAYEAWAAGADTPSADALRIPAQDDDALRRSTPGGTPGELVDELRAILAPVRDREDVHLVVRLHYPGMELGTASAAIERFAAEVAPSLRAG